MSGIGYRPEIDGLRAVAVIPVILFHMGLSWLPGGFIGVDVFFVISGFLITSIIKKELDAGTFSFRDFWARRVRRILPAMIFVTVCTLAATYFLVFRPEQQVIGKQALASLLSVANIYFWQSTGDYWGTAAEASPFLHAWSLSVEEQFYLFFPVTMWLIFRFRAQWLQVCIAVATVVSLCLFLWGVQADPTATFYLLPARVWELGTGCLLAVSLNNQLSTNSNYGIFATVGLAVVVVSYMFFDTLSAGLGLAVISTALIIAFGKTGLCNKLLSLPPMVHIGKLSYSLYLWHWPVIVLAEPAGVVWAGPTDQVILVVVTYLLALLTYQLVEKPTRRRKGIVPPVLISGTLVAGIAAGIAYLFPSYWDTTEYSEPRYVTFDCNPDQEGLEFPPRPYQRLDFPRFATTMLENPEYRPDAFSGEGIRVGDRLQPPEIVVVGDSHGCMWSDAIASVAKEDGLNAAFYCWRGMDPFANISLSSEHGKQGVRFQDAKLSHIQKWKPKLVIVGKSWVEKDVSDAKAMIEFVGRQGSRVLLIEDPPRFPCGNNNALQWLASKKIQPVIGEECFLPSKLLSPSEKGRGVVRSLAGSYDHVDFLPTYDLYSSDSGVLALDGRDAMYLDDDHLLQAGAKKIIPRLRAEIIKTLTK